MPAVFAKVSRDTVTTGRDCELGSAHWIRVTATARIADRGNVVDVNTKTQAGDRSAPLLSIRPLNDLAHPVTRSALATTFLARICEMIELRCLRL